MSRRLPTCADVWTGEWQRVVTIQSVNAVLAEETARVVLAIVTHTVTDVIVVRTADGVIVTLASCKMR